MGTQEKKRDTILYLSEAGIAGFEPAHTGIRIQGLTIWRYPNVIQLFQQLLPPQQLQIIREKNRFCNT